MSDTEKEPITKQKRPRTEAQILSFQKAREARMKNLEERETHIYI